MGLSTASIYFHIRRAPAAEIPRILTDARFATLFVHAADAAEFDAYSPSGPAIAASLDAIRKDPSLKAALSTAVQGARRLSSAIPADVDEYIRQAEAFAADLRRPEPSDLCHLDKAWHVLHYFFTGQAEIGSPPAGTLCSGIKVGEPLVYGRARLAEAALTREFADFLDTQVVADLHRKLDMQRMHALGVYGCEQVDALHTDRAHRWVRAYPPRLRRFVRATADAGDGLLMWLR